MKHGNMRNDLNNLFLTGNREAYPKTVADAMRMMEGWRRSNPTSQQQPQKREGNGDDGLSFVQAKLDEQELEDEKPAASQPSALKANQKKNKKKKEKVQFNDKTKDAAGNSVIPHQSHATAGEEEETVEDALEECPHCNGEHTLADCPDLTLEQLEAIYAQLGEEEGAGEGYL